MLLVRRQLEALTVQLQESRLAVAQEAQRQTTALLDAERRHIETNTLRACERYFSDSVIHSATHRIWNAAEKGTTYVNNPNISVHDCITVFNYLNGIAVGAKEGIFSGRIVRDHIPNTIIEAVDNIMPAVLSNMDGYEATIDLRKSWKDGVSYQR